MIRFTYNLKWNGPVILSRVEREVKRAVRQGAERVRRAAKDPLLNRSGKTQTGASGINRGNLAARWNRGVQGMRNLSIINLGPSQLAFGGTYRYQDRRNRNHTYQIDRVYWYGEPLHRWVQSSFPGTAPHKQTGTLQRSIAVETINDGMRAKVGPGNGLRYARIQELGGRTRFGTLPERPYMGPALRMTQSAILQDFYKAVARATS
jgi:phage gpG-like protein